MQNLHDGLLILPSGVDKEHEATMDTELPSTKDIQPLPVQEPPQDSDICQLIRKNEQEVKNVVEQPIERGNHSIQSLQNFKVVHKSSISSNTSQISSIHSIAPILSTKEPEHLLSMGYEHLSITLKTKSDEVTESNAENLLPIPSEREVTLEDKKEFYDDDFEDIEYIEASLSDPKNVSIEEENSVEEENVVQQKEEEVNFEDISQIQDVVLREKLLSITCLISNIESLNDNPTPDRVLNSFASDNSLLDNFSPEFETFCDHTEETRSVNTTHANYSLPEYDSFCFEIELDQERLINLVENDILNNSINDLLLEEVDLFLSDDSIPPGEETLVVMNDKDEDVNYSYSMFVIFDKMFSLLSAESEDTIFDLGFFPSDEVFLCWIFVRFPRSSYPLIDSSLGNSISFDLFSVG
nr:hypothetical protein [Tanacetum cinerariifolium]